MILLGKFYYGFTSFLHQFYKEFTTKLGNSKRIEYTFSPKNNGNMFRRNIPVNLRRILFAAYFRRKFTKHLRRNVLLVILRLRPFLVTSS